MIGINSPIEIVEGNVEGAVRKANLPLNKMILLGIMAGMFIALGGATSSTAAHAVTNVGVSRMIAGAVFPIGLMMIVFVGGELFTGNCLIFMAVLDGKVSWKKFVRNLFVVYLSNLVGALIIDVLIYFSGNLNYSGGQLGAYAIKVALGKIAVTPLQGITSGILCNILVCVAILMAAAAKDVAGKVWAIFFPIFAFVIGGFEHCVANMFYIPMGILAAKSSTYVDKAREVYGITADELSELTVANSLHNFIPVTIGNVIGGAVCVGCICYVIYEKLGAQKTNK